MLGVGANRVQLPNSQTPSSAKLGNLLFLLSQKMNLGHPFIKKLLENQMLICKCEEFDLLCC